MRMILSQHHQG